MLLPKEIGIKIKKKRIELNLSQEKLAELADISITFLSQIEGGKRNITVVTLQSISKALKTNVQYFFPEIHEIQLAKNQLQDEILREVPKLDFEKTSMLHKILALLKK